jgi:hypothetical protein
MDDSQSIRQSCCIVFHFACKDTANREQNKTIGFVFFLASGTYPLCSTCLTYTNALSCQINLLKKRS